MPLQVTDTTPSSDLKPHGNVVLVVVDIQGGGQPSSFGADKPGYMAGRPERNAKAVDMVARFRDKGVPVVFIQEVHKPSLVDIGRELDGAESVHCVEGDPRTALHPGLEPRPEEYLIQKRRYSAFFGSELDIVLKGYRADTLILIGGMTDVCIHYTAVDAHQLDYRFRTVSDMVIGSSQRAHDAALRAMKYLQRDALVTLEAVDTWLDALPTPATTEEDA
ncbi:MAG: cysteine hydrolase family protein [Demequina sp.]|uniref:cysteine hydrolase family protein n=1 Tax=Demequina sp. TaxID=2050685 RepID=UPI003A89B97F